jgi:hypothetical protein
LRQLVNPLFPFIYLLSLYTRPFLGFDSLIGGIHHGRGNELLAVFKQRYPQNKASLEQARIAGIIGPVLEILYLVSRLSLQV